MPLDDSNLVARALHLVGRTRRRAASTSGSRTAAASAAARPTRRRCCAGPADADAGRGGRLGADVPFCLVGGRARVTGIGELVEPLPHVEPSSHAVSRRCTVAPPAVYRAWDDLGGPTADGRQRPGAGGARVGTRARAMARLIRSASGAHRSSPGVASTWFVEGDHRRPRGPDRRGRNGGRGTTGAGRRRAASWTTCDAGGACGAASSCASSSACAYDAS